MFLDKFRNRYSFNFLSICGWIIFLLLCICFFPYIFEDELGFPIFLIFIIILSLNILFYLITFFIYVFEIVSWKRITNENFLDNKYIKIIQYSGIIFAFLPIIMIVLLFVFDFFKDIIYNIQGID